MFVYHKVKGIPLSSLSSKFDLFKLFLRGSPGLSKVLFAPVAITILYRCLSTGRGLEVKKGEKDMLLWSSKRSWKDYIIQWAVSTTFFKDIWKYFIGNNSIKNIPQHNLSLEPRKHSKRLQSKCGGQNTSYPVTSDSHVYDLEAVLRELLNLGQWRRHKLYAVLQHVIPHKSPIPLTFLPHLLSFLRPRLYLHAGHPLSTYQSFPTRPQVCKLPQAPPSHST